MDQAPNPAPAEWLAALAESEAELDRGKTVPASTVRRQLTNSIARLEAKQRKEPPDP